MAEPFINDPDFTLHVGDALETLQAMPAESVHCCVTSPPYWGLRDYGTGTWEGGDPECFHMRQSAVSRRSSTLVGSTDTQGGVVAWKETCGHCGARRVDQQLGLEPTPDLYVTNMVAVFREVRRVLRADGTLWLNIGDSYASGTGRGYSRDYMDGGAVTDERIMNDTPRFDIKASGFKPKDLCGIPWLLAFALRADGWYLRSDIIWSKPNPMPESVTDRPTKAHEYLFLLAKGQWKTRVVALADLSGELGHLSENFGPDHPNVWAHELSIRLASALLDLPQLHEEFRLPPLNSKVWEKITRCAKGDEVGGLPIEHGSAVLAARLLTANASTKEFLCEIDRLGIALTDGDKFLIGGGPTEFPLPPGVYRYGKGSIAIHHPGEIREFDLIGHCLKHSRPGGCSYFYDADAIREPQAESTIERAQFARHQWRYAKDVSADSHVKPQLGPNRVEANGRSKRSVWEIATEAYPDAHFATFPQALVEPCVKAGCPEWVCGTCGKARERISEETPEYAAWKARESGWAKRSGDLDMGRGTAGSGTNSATVPPKNKTVGWTDCGHNNYQPGVVLDTFLGSGTTAQVARRLGRRSIGIELNPTYAELAARRLQQQTVFACVVDESAGLAEQEAKHG